MTNVLNVDIHWLGHDSFRIEADDRIIYIDPWQLAETPEADLILITHDHGDHCSPEDVARIQGKETVIVTCSAAAAQLSGNIHLMAPNDSGVVRGVAIEAIPAYNINKFRSPGVPFHPREAGYLGFIVTVGGRRIYHPGDADFIPEMRDLSVDIALLPVSGRFVMTADEAIEAASAIDPQVAIPMHVGRGIGSLDNATYFQEHAAVPVQVLPLST